MNNIIPINDLRRKFGIIESNLPYVDCFILTKKGKPFATLTATLEIKRNIIKKFAGSLKNTELDNDSLWKKVLTKKSRKDSVKI